MLESVNCFRRLVDLCIGIDFKWIVTRFVYCLYLTTNSTKQTNLRVLDLIRVIRSIRGQTLLVLPPKVLTSR